MRRKDLRKLLTRCLPGGYQEKVQVSAGATDTSTTFDGVVLNNSARRPTKRQHLFVTTEGRDVKAIQNEVIMSLCNFLTGRLGSDKEAGKLSYALEFEAILPLACKERTQKTSTLNVYTQVLFRMSTRKTSFPLMES